MWRSDRRQILGPRPATPTPRRCRLRLRHRMQRARRHRPPILAIRPGCPEDRRCHAARGSDVAELATRTIRHTNSRAGVAIRQWADRHLLWSARGPPSGPHRCGRSQSPGSRTAGMASADEPTIRLALRSQANHRTVCAVHLAGIRQSANKPRMLDSGHPNTSQVVGNSLRGLRFPRVSSRLLHFWGVRPVAMST